MVDEVKRPTIEEEALSILLASQVARKIAETVSAAGGPPMGVAIVAALDALTRATVLVANVLTGLRA